jgi:hypothetical protein
VEEIPDSYKEFQRLRLPILHPLDPPISLPVLPKDIDPGVLPDYSEFSDSVHGVRGGNPQWEILQVAQEQSAESLLPQKKTSQTNKVESTRNGPLKELMDWREKYILESHYASSDKRTQGGEFMEEEINAKYVIRGGATGASNILNGYLRFLEPTGRDDWKAVYEHIWNMEKKPGASFRALFGSTLALGTLSRRRVLYEALKYEKERNGGRLSPFGFSTFTVAAAVGDVKSIEVVLTIVSRNKCFLYCCLQFSMYGILCPSTGKLMCSPTLMQWSETLHRKSLAQGSVRGFKVTAWQWRGYHTQVWTKHRVKPAHLMNDILYYSGGYTFSMTYV